MNSIVRTMLSSSSVRIACTNMATINLWPILNALLYVIAAGMILTVGGVVLLFLLGVVTAPFRAISSRRSGKGMAEFDEGVIFYGGLALVILMIYLAFRFRVVAFE